MSINPAQAIGPLDPQPFANDTTRLMPQSAPSTEPRLSRSVSEPNPRQESENSGATSAYTEIPHDEVQVQHDNEANGNIVIKYLDQSGNVILQIPSSQILGIARSIDQDFQHAAEDRETAEKNTSALERNSHGH